MIPVADLLGQTLLHHGPRLVNPIHASRAHFRQMFGNDTRYRMALGLLFKLASDPRTLGAVENGGNIRLIGRKRTIVQVGRVVQVARVA